MSDNSVGVELNVPRLPGVDERITGFYDSIGWNVLKEDGNPYDTVVMPDLADEDNPPELSYWQTETGPNKADLYTYYKNHYDPSVYAHGWRLPSLLEVEETCLYVPGDEEVRALYELGGAVLRAHSHIRPRQHAGRLEFRFSDPFNIALRVTSRSRRKLHRIN